MRKTAAIELGLAAKHPEVMAIFLTDGIMSEVEDGADTAQPQGTPSKKNWAWRDETLREVVGLLDEAFIQQAPSPRAKRERKAKVEKLNKGKSKDGMPPNLDQEPEIPTGIPSNWVIPSALTCFSEIEKKALNLKAPILLGPARDYLASQLLREPRPARPQPTAPIASTSTQ